MSTFVQNGKKIIAIGRNYAAHIKELSNTAPKEPFFFLKPTSSYVRSGGQIEIPRGVVVHHEVELGVVIGKRGRDITQSQAEDYIVGYALAIDMTARNVQDEVKKLGLPWSTAKGFDTFTPIGPFIPKSEIQDAHDLLLTLKINGTVKQHGSTADMISRTPRLIEHISSIMTLEENDLILTGTPSGVGPISPEDNIECSLTTPAGTELSSIVFKAVARQGGYEFKGK